MLNTTPTRYQTISAIAATDLNAIFTAAEIDPAAGREVLGKLMKSLEPKKSTGEDSAVKIRNRNLFNSVVRPFLEQHPEGVTAAIVAEGCEGLPVSAEGTTTTQTASAILRLGVAEGGATVLPKDEAKAWHKAHKNSGNGFVYIAA